MRYIPHYYCYYCMGVLLGWFCDKNRGILVVRHTRTTKELEDPDNRIMLLLLLYTRYMRDRQIQMAYLRSLRFGY